MIICNDLQVIEVTLVNSWLRKSTLFDYRDLKISTFFYRPGVKIMWDAVTSKPTVITTIIVDGLITPVFEGL